jgi:rsbT antagonist protein RsbS
MQFQADLIDQVGIHRARGIVIDVAALDVLGSFASKSLHDLAYMTRLRRAETVIVGIQPEVAFALVQLPGRSRCTPR